MINRVHGLAPDVRSSAHVPFSTGLAKFDILMVGITQTTDGRPALFANHPHFPARQYDSDPITFLGQDSRYAAGASDQLSSLARAHLDIMNLKPRRDACQRHGVARLGLTRIAAFHQITNLYPERTENIPFLPVRIMQ